MLHQNRTTGTTGRMTSKLDQLKTMTTVVADTGDIDAIAQWRPEDATTNPSLLLKAAASDAYRPMLDKAVAIAAKHGGSSADQLSVATDMLAVRSEEHTSELQSRPH